MVQRQIILDACSSKGDCAGQLRFTHRKAANSPVVQSAGPSAAPMSNWQWQDNKSSVWMRADSWAGEMDSL